MAVLCCVLCGCAVPVPVAAVLGQVYISFPALANCMGQISQQPKSKLFHYSGRYLDSNVFNIFSSPPPKKKSPQNARSLSLLEIKIKPVEAV